MRVEDALRSVDRRLFIAGECVDAAGGATFTTWNPATDEPLAEIACGSSVDVHQAVGLALWRPTDATKVAADGLGAHALRHYTHVTNVWVRPG